MSCPHWCASLCVEVGFVSLQHPLISRRYLPAQIPTVIGLHWASMDDCKPIPIPIGLHERVPFRGAPASTPGAVPRSASALPRLEDRVPAASTPEPRAHEAGTDGSPRTPMDVSPPAQGAQSALPGPPAPPEGGGSWGGAVANEGNNAATDAEGGVTTDASHDMS